MACVRAPRPARDQARRQVRRPLVVRARGGGPLLPQRGHLPQRGGRRLPWRGLLLPRGARLLRQPNAPSALGVHGRRVGVALPRGGFLPARADGWRVLTASVAGPYSWCGLLGHPRLGGLRHLRRGAQMPRRAGRKGAAPSPRGLHLAQGLVRTPGLPAPALLLRVRGQLPAAAERRALLRLGSAQAQQQVLAQARVTQAPRPLVPAAGVALRRVLALQLVLALLRLVRARRVPGQGCARREHRSRAEPGLAPPRVSSQPRPVRSWIGHG